MFFSHIAYFLLMLAYFLFICSLICLFSRVYFAPGTCYSLGFWKRHLDFGSPSDWAPGVRGVFKQMGLLEMNSSSKTPRPKQFFFCPKKCFFRYENLQYQDIPICFFETERGRFLSSLGRPGSNKPPTWIQLALSTPKQSLSGFGGG